MQSAAVIVLIRGVQRVVKPRSPKPRQTVQAVITVAQSLTAAVDLLVQIAVSVIDIAHGARVARGRGGFACQAIQRVIRIGGDSAVSIGHRGEVAVCVIVDIARQDGIADGRLCSVTKRIIRERVGLGAAASIICTGETVKSTVGIGVRERAHVLLRRLCDTIICRVISAFYDRLERADL